MTQVYPVRDRHGVGKSGVTREARFGGFRYAKLRLRLKPLRTGRFSDDGGLLTYEWFRRTFDRQASCLAGWKSWSIYFWVTDTDPSGFSLNGYFSLSLSVLSTSSVRLSQVHYSRVKKTSPGCPNVRVSVIRLGLLYLERAWCLHRNKWVMH